MIPPVPQNEPERQKALLRYQILDTAAEQVFDDLTLLASHICGTPIALISLVDGNRQWFKSRVGVDVTETARDISFCGHAILQPRMFVIPDATLDYRFANNPLVTSDPKIRFYAGMPLYTDDGHGLGVLCVIDREPRQIKPEQQQALEALARQVMSQLDLRLALAQKELAEEKLQDQTALLRDAERLARVGSWEHDPVSGKVICSEETLRIFELGTTDAAVDREVFMSKVHPDDEERVRGAMRAKQGQQIEYRIQPPGGVERSLRSYTTWAVDRNGVPVKRRGAIQDITEQKNAENALRRSEELFRSLSESSPIGIYTTDADGNCTFTNERWQTLTGLSLQESLGDGWARSIHPEDRPGVFRSWVDCALSGKEFSREFRIRTPLGEMRWVHSSAKALRAEDGSVTGYVGTNEDITERKLAMERLMESEARFRTLADSAPVLIWMSRMDKLFTLVNKPWLEFTGRTLEHELGFGWMDAVHPEDTHRCFEIYKVAFDQRKKMLLEYRLRRHDGQYRWMMNVGTPRFNESGQFLGYIGSCIDVTERKKAEDAARETSEQLHAQQLKAAEQEHVLLQQQTQIQTLREVMLTLMDKINNPLAVIMMVFELWQRDHSLPEGIVKSMDTVRNAANRISGVLQEVSKLEQYRTLETSFGKVLDVYSQNITTPVIGVRQ